ncbi:MAG: Na+/H+ antiporter NhaC family protein [Myxococcota bacterium]
MSHGFLSVVPALVAVGLAVVSRNVVVSLGAAVVVAGLIATRSLGEGLLHALDTTVVGAMADVDHARTILFTVLIGGMVGVVGRSGATRAVVERLARRARSPRSVMVLSWVSGLVVFFDDYANCMIVGSAMGPLYDEQRLSRQKLAYIVDSTAAPVASLALVSTWVGFEVSVISDGLEAAGRDVDAYAFFLQGWPYRFYPILALGLVGWVATSGRDIGPMRIAGTHATAAAPHRDEATKEEGGAPWWAAVLPVGLLVGVTLVELYRTGTKGTQGDAPLYEILGAADGYAAIVHGSAVALIAAFAAAVASRGATFEACFEAMLRGMKLMVEAVIILVLAWSVSAAMKELGAPQYLVGVMAGALPAVALPTVVFVVGAAISFAVGSSYTTMGIMMPIVIPLAYQLAPAGGGDLVPLAASGSVLAGACFGDHCSPISDTTVLSSIGSGADLLAHVKTQLPYALLAGGVAISCGTVPAGFGVNPWLCIAVGLLVLGAVVHRFGARATPSSLSAAAVNPADGRDGHARDEPPPPSVDAG